MPMWRVMAALLDEGEQRLGDLARLTAIELSTLSRIAAAMEARNLVTRRRSGQDARAVIIALTPEGRAKTESIVPRAMDWESMAVAGMTEDEVRVLKGLLQRLYGNVAGPEPLPGPERD
nr:MarR family winged helix-turn-helix transcriptional regulator [Magnetospirillum aberrantis]